MSRQRYPERLYLMRHKKGHYQSAPPISLNDSPYRFLDTLTARVGKLTDPSLPRHRVDEPLSYVTQLGHFIYQGS